LILFEKNGRHPAAYSNGEDYQIAFLRDNLFLLDAAGEITLAILHLEHDATPISLED
jgi:hypothetical protein